MVYNRFASGSIPAFNGELSIYNLSGGAAPIVIDQGTDSRVTPRWDSLGRNLVYVKKSPYRTGDFAGYSEELYVSSPWCKQLNSRRSGIWV